MIDATSESLEKCVLDFLFRVCMKGSRYVPGTDKYRKMELRNFVNEYDHSYVSCSAIPLFCYVFSD